MKSLLLLPLALPVVLALGQVSGRPRTSAGTVPKPADSVVLPTYAKLALPPAGTPGSLARLSDGTRGVWMDGGSRWFALASGATNVQEHGALGDGVADDTAAVQAALDSGAATVLFPPGSYAVRTLQVPNEIRLVGYGATLVAQGVPQELLLVDATSEPREHVHIVGFSFQGSATYLIHLRGPVRMSSVRDVRVLGGAGSAVVRVFNDSAALNGARVRIDGIDARVSGWDNAVRIQRGPQALAAGVAFDNFEIERIHHWAGEDVVRVDAPLLNSRITQIYGGLFAAQGQCVVRVDTDAGYGRHLRIEDVFMETWKSSSVAVRLRGLEYVTVDGAEASRLNTSLFGVRAVRAEDVRFGDFRMPMIRDVGTSPADSPSGYYPAIEFTSDTRDNVVRFPDPGLVGNRVLDDGLRNRVEGDKNDRFLAADHARASATGATAEVVLKSLDLPGNTLGARDGVHVVSAGTVLGGSGTSVVRFRWGGTPIASSTLTFAPGETGSWRFEAWIWNDGMGGQRISLLTHRLGAPASHALVSATVDTSQDVALQVTGQPGTAADTVTAELFLVESAYKLRVY